MQWQKQAVEKLKLELDEHNIGGGYNTVNIVDFQGTIRSGSELDIKVGGKERGGDR